MPTARAVDPEGSHPSSGKPDEFGEKPDELGEKSDEFGGQPHELVIPADLAGAITALNQWTPQPELRRLIVRLCAWKPMSAGELAALLHRSPRYLRTSYLTPMIQSGELVYTNPEKPNDPGQRYRLGREA